jgi:hypothetical protein
VPYDILDFPGVADAEETDNQFFDACVTWGLKCDVVCLVSDIRTSFMTVHEKAEFERVRDVLQDASVHTGRLFQFCIGLTKYDFDDTTKARSPVHVERGEIADPEEETTVTDCLARVERMFPDTRICKFNAFGRIAHRAGSSEALRALLSRMAPPRNVNTTFELQWAVESLPLRRQKRMLDSLFQVRFAIPYDFHADFRCRCHWRAILLRFLGVEVLDAGRGRGHIYNTPKKLIKKIIQKNRLKKRGPLFFTKSVFFIVSQFRFLFDSIVRPTEWRKYQVRSRRHTRRWALPIARA